MDTLDEFSKESWSDRRPKMSCLWISIRRSSKNFPKNPLEKLPWVFLNNSSLFFQIHRFFQKYFEKIKGYSRKLFIDNICQIMCHNFFSVLWLFPFASFNWLPARNLLNLLNVQCLLFTSNVDYIHIRSL